MPSDPNIIEDWGSATEDQRREAVAATIILLRDGYMPFVADFVHTLAADRRRLMAEVEALKAECRAWRTTESYDLSESTAEGIETDERKLREARAATDALHLLDATAPEAGT